jgi:hypothetical protein
MKMIDSYSSYNNYVVFHGIKRANGNEASAYILYRQLEKIINNIKFDEKYSEDLRIRSMLIRKIDSWNKHKLNEVMQKYNDFDGYDSGKIKEIIMTMNFG